ncbi:variable large family protein [Borreliella afzelii]|uniref:variable large family protein n=1 Tax=Borreliella afzelii TaxID=29518 RepID=UPI0035936EBF
MKKISSAIFLAALIVFINCKSNVATANTENQDDSVTKFYQSIVSLGNGFLDVFKSFGELVADTLGLKADPKKSEVKNYFSTMASKLEATKKGIDGLKVKTPEGDSGKSIKSAVESAVALIEKLIAAAKEVEAAATGTASEAVGTVVKAADDAGAGVADADSVKGIAKGIKAIVDAVGGDAKLTAAAANGEDNKDAGKLFGKSDNGGDEKDASKAAGAVSAVSGEQIIKAIVDAAGTDDQEQKGAKANEAKNPIAAAIGKANEDAAAFGDNKMKKDDQIAAAIALRGMAKNGKFAVKNANEADAKGAVKSAAESAVTKVLTTLASLVQKAVGEGLSKVSEAIKKAGDSDKGGTAAGTGAGAGAGAGAGK